MKILIDHQTFELQKFGGISRYFYELFLEFQNTPNIEAEISIQYSDNEYIKNLPQLQKKINKNDIFQKSFGGKEFRGKKMLFKLLREKKIKVPDYSLINRESTIKKLKEGNFDVFHATYYDNYFLQYIGNKPYVITVYDLIHQIYPEYFLETTIDKNVELFKNASHIIAISHSTKKDLIDFYNIPSEKISVIHLASSLKKTKTLDESFKKIVPENYLLFVGNRTIYKNFYFLAEAFAQIIESFPNLKLVCTGSSFSKNEINFLEKLNISDSVIQYFVDDNQLIYLYENALCFVFPSIYEGFGIPVLEAFENNCCTLLANSSSLPEIGEDGALYFEPKNFKSLKTNLEKIITDNSLRQRLISQGSEINKKFSWSKTSNETLTAYKLAIQNNIKQCKEA